MKFRLTKPNILIVMTIVSILLFASQATLFADGPNHPRGPFAELNLTDDQRQQIHSIRENMRRVELTVRPQIELLKMDIANELRADNPDKNKLNGIIDSILAQEKKLMQAKMDMVIQIKALLTPEQRAKLHDMAFFEHFAGRGPHHGQRGGGHPGPPRR